MQAIVPQVFRGERLALADAVCSACESGFLGAIDVRLEAVIRGLMPSHSRPAAIDVGYFSGDESALRAIAKIGFNYLALKHGTHAALEGRFDPIRHYIRDGKGGGERQWVQLAYDSPRMPFRRIEGSHLVSLVSTKEGIVGFGSLFGYLDFMVHLGPDTSRDAPIPNLTYLNFETGEINDVSVQDMELYFVSSSQGFPLTSL